MHDRNSHAYAGKSARTLRRPMHDPPRILVAEDDADMLALLVEVLDADGYDVQAARDGGRLLVELARGEKCSYDEVDLVITDVVMPVCTGMQIVETLRAAHCMVPVILMSGLADERLESRAELLDAILFTKPFSVDALRNTVAELMTSES
jgi:DNA-binding response OmpR family regulator